MRARGDGDAIAAVARSGGVTSRGINQTHLRPIRSITMDSAVEVIQIAGGRKAIRLAMKMGSLCRCRKGTELVRTVNKES